MYSVLYHCLTYHFQQEKKGLKYILKYHIHLTYFLMSMLLISQKKRTSSEFTWFKKIDSIYEYLQHIKIKITTKWTGLRVLIVTSEGNESTWELHNSKNGWQLTSYAFSSNILITPQRLSFRKEDPTTHPRTDSTIFTYVTIMPIFNKTLKRYDSKICWLSNFSKINRPDLGNEWHSLELANKYGLQLWIPALLRTFSSDR